MDNIVIMNAAFLSEYALSEVMNGKNSFQYALSAAERMPEAEVTAAIVRQGCLMPEFPEKESFRLYSLKENSIISLISLLIEISEGYRDIFYFFADCPLIDTDLTEKMYANHGKYFSEYTFADGFPAGTGVEIINTSILPVLKKLAGDDRSPVERKSVFSVIEKDINTFEIETEISPDDQRLLRVSLFPDTRRNFLQLRAMFPLLEKRGAFSGDVSLSEAVLKTVRENGEILRTLPVFYEIETTCGSRQQVSYMPEEDRCGTDEMKLEDFSALAGRIGRFSEDAVISLSVRNEPSLHSDPAGLAEAVLAVPGLKLLIETSGTGWKEGDIERILALDGGRITWIIDLDALDTRMYRSLRGEGREEAYAFSERLLSESPENVYLQAVRMKENELDTEQFYKYWKEKTNNVIIQKYDWCCGKLEQKKVTDLSPVKRLPCWHLKRDMIIRSDGTVPLCRDDIECSHVFGNVFSDSLEEIWNKGLDIYRQHLEEDYPGLCLNCDEYYTFNY